MKSKNTLTVAAALLFLAGCGGFVYTTVGGDVSGLGANTISLRNEQNYTVQVAGDGHYSFKIASNAKYAISINAQPNTVNCVVKNPTGVMTTEAPLTTVAVQCTPNVALAGLRRGLFTSRLSDNAADAPTVQLLINNQHIQILSSTGVAGDANDPTADGIFSLANYVVSGTPYTVTVRTQPAGEFCSVQNGTGIADNTVTTLITNLVVSCVPAVPIGGQIIGLDAGDGIVFINNADEKVVAVKAGKDVSSTPISFRFPTSLLGGGKYTVTVSQQPDRKTCTITNGTGTVAIDNRAGASNVQVNCVKN